MRQNAGLAVFHPVNPVIHRAHRRLHRDVQLAQPLLDIGEDTGIGGHGNDRIDPVKRHKLNAIRLFAERDALKDRLQLLHDIGGPAIGGLKQTHALIRKHVVVKQGQHVHRAAHAARVVQNDE